MKRTNAVVTKQADLARQRALVRDLIERHGWSSIPTAVGGRSRADRSLLPANVIQFPGTPK